MDKRLDLMHEQMDKRLDLMCEQMGKRLDSVENRLNHIETWLRWMFSILITMWVTIILAILLK
jgi:hypothetical protein